MANKERGRGIPRDDLQRAMDHYGITAEEYLAHPGWYPLPPRGQGLEEGRAAIGQVASGISKSIALNPGEAKQVQFQFVPTEVRVHQVSVDGLSGSFSVIEPPPPQAIELVDAWFDGGQPMAKEPTDTFTVSLKLKNNLAKDWSPGNILFSFGHKTNGDFVRSPIVWGENPFTGEVMPEFCGEFGRWPLATWPVIPAGATKTFTTTYGFCPQASEGIYDGFIQMAPNGSMQTIILPAILVIAWPQPKLEILNAALRDCRIGMKYGRFKIYGTLDLTLRNDEGRTLTGQSPDYVDNQITIYRQKDGAKVGFVRLSTDIPPGANTLALTPSIGFGSDVPLSPGTLNYRVNIKIVLSGWPGNPYVGGEFPGTTVLS